MEPNSKMIFWCIVGFLLLGGALEAVHVHNGLVTEEENMQLAVGNLNVEFQNRMETIPQMVKVAQASLQAQKDIPVAYAEAREGSLAKMQAADSQFSTAVKNNDTAGAMEAYTLAKSNFDTFDINLRSESVPGFDSAQLTQLNNEMVSIQNCIKYQRENYNAAVKSYNLIGRRLPGSLFAGLFGFEPKVGFQADVGADDMPDTTIVIE